MKIKINIDCTPEEARRFFGLPDIGPMQDRVMAEMEKKIMDSMDLSDPDAIVKHWFAGGVKGVDQLQKAFWSQFAGADRKKTPDDQ